MLYLVTLEPLETRYTKQWKVWFKEEFPDSIEIDGKTRSGISNNKNFLDIFNTNKWKSEQISKMADLFNKKLIKPNDKFLFYDAWHYGIIAVKYMSLLSGINIKIYSYWHAGSYDPYDLLGLVGANKYFNGFEKSLLDCSDISFVTTDFHKKMIINNFGNTYKDKIKVVGFPYKIDYLNKYKMDRDLKKNQVIFPHRLSVEKRIDLFRRMKNEIKDMSFVVSLEECKTKKDYYKLLTSSKFLFSANLQETFGISAVEGVFLDVVPFIPNRLSYEEMYISEFKYENLLSDNEIIKTFLHFVKQINSMNKNKLDELLKIQRQILINKFVGFEKIKEYI